MKLTAEELAALNECSNAEEVVAMAAAAGYEITREQAEKLLSIAGFEELNVDEIDSVSGGCGTGFVCYFCNKSFDYAPQHFIDLSTPSDDYDEHVCNECYEANKNRWDVH